MIKTANELKAQAKLKNIEVYPVHDCSMCGYPCGYVIDGDNVSYDSGCYCTYRFVVEPRSWEDLARCYNMNQPENNPNIKQGFLDKLNETWQFPEYSHVAK
jgi:hypothetical protein